MSDYRSQEIISFQLTGSNIQHVYTIIFSYINGHRAGQDTAGCDKPSHRGIIELIHSLEVPNIRRRDLTQQLHKELPTEPKDTNCWSRSVLCVRACVCVQRTYKFPVCQVASSTRSSAAWATNWFKLFLSSL